MFFFVCIIDDWRLARLLLSKTTINVYLKDSGQPAARGFTCVSEDTWTREKMQGFNRKLLALRKLQPSASFYSVEISISTQLQLTFPVESNIRGCFEIWLLKTGCCNTAEAESWPRLWRSRSRDGDQSWNVSPHLADRCQSNCSVLFDADGLLQTRDALPLSQRKLLTGVHSFLNPTMHLTMKRSFSLDHEHSYIFS